ncbi:diphthine--ammonia ligase [Seonamhaeicola sp. ML3]|uniref:Dph6-related ATP pyrophosphatase n=1 Tax=Seonamhaeicola sp. ML3 TaxID=2937786 RepID=UPI00200BAF39|nr:diphthine--ammonia ligase [Seonamhaeicola sp. ML3]
MNFLCSWSGGKDSCFAFYRAVNLGYRPKVLLNVLNELGERSRSHGIPKNILQAQANALGLPIHFFNSTWEDYEVNYIKKLIALEGQYPITHTVFGDIDIESHRAWEEKVSKAANLNAVLPLWQGKRSDLVLEMIDSGIEAIIVSCNEDLGPDYLGRVVSKALVKELEDKGVDACGENGEFHTLVVNAPFFKSKINIEILEKQYNGNYNFALLKLL